MVCSRRLYKGNSYEICLPMKESGVTSVFFYTDGELKIEKTPVISGDTMCFDIDSSDIEPIADGVLRYEAFTEDGSYDTNTPFVIITPEGYDAKTLDEIKEESYQSGYTDGVATCEDCDDAFESGYTSGYSVGYEVGLSNCVCNYHDEFFTVHALEDGDFYVRSRGIKCSINGCEWVDVDASSPLSLSFDDEVRFRGTDIMVTSGIGTFSGNTIKFTICGNILSVLYGDQFLDPGAEDSPHDYTECFSGSTGLLSAINLVIPGVWASTCKRMFAGCVSLVNPPTILSGTVADNACYEEMFSGCTSMTSAPVLPSIYLTTRCYAYMFSHCTSLRTAPELPSMDLAESCYEGMFEYCYSLTTAPELPAMALADMCYEGMFSNCTIAKAPALPAMYLAVRCYSYMFESCVSLTRAPALPATTLADYCYQNMFRTCLSLVNPPALPATALTLGCYYEMFRECTSLATAPELPATALAKNCYAQMFYSCSSLTTAPELPATTLEQGCYARMFEKCTRITTAPELPATALAKNCYVCMFQDCRALTTAPELPATTLAQSCYTGMFVGCTSLTTAPVLSATTSAIGCYTEMFYFCTSLNYIKCLATDITTIDCTSAWVARVAPSGTFVKKAGASWTTGDNGIPSGWTVIEE